MNRSIIWSIGLATVLTSAARAQYRDAIDNPRTTPDNPVARLDRLLAAGERKLSWHKEVGYLQAVLRELKVPVSSQALVFSRTSLQLRVISPATPRAIYFSDDVYIGYCQNGDVLEISATDAKLGTVFYTMEQRSDLEPRFARQTDNCLMCHETPRTHGVPGHLVRSLYTDARGFPLLNAGTHRVDQSLPLAKRFGGWYVTGTHGKQTHLGNLIVTGREVKEPVDNTSGHNLTDLGKRFDRTAYLSPHSDMVAQLVLAHQTDAHNLLTRASFTAREALQQEQQLNREMKLPADHRWDSTMVRIRGAGDDLLKYLLFCDEAALSGKIEGTSSFAADFAKLGPRDKRGRSLRDFDLEKRLFAYPCSYLIYSESFDALPDKMREYVLERLWKVLTGRNTSKEFAHLSSADRKAIREILVATKKNLPPYWRE